MVSGLSQVQGITAVAGGSSGTTLDVPSGGTGANSFTVNAIIKGNGTSPLVASGVLIDSSNNITGAGTIASGDITVTSSTATALSVGKTGATNPTLKVDASDATVNGLQIRSFPSFPLVESIGSASTVGLVLGSKGGGTVYINSGQTELQFGSTTRYTINQSVFAYRPAASGVAGNPHFDFQGAADTGLTAGAEAVCALWDMSQTRQHLSNTAITLQRDFRVIPSTHSFVTAGGVITDAAALGITGGPLGGTNATLTNSHALYIPTWTAVNTTNAYGITVAAPTAGSSTNYAINAGATLINSASATALVVGPNGATNPLLQLDASTASMATGLKLTGAASGGTVTLEAVSSGANGGLQILTKGSGNLLASANFGQATLAGGGGVILNVGGVSMATVTAAGSAFVGGVDPTATNARFRFTGAADTNLTASTEAPNAQFLLNQTRNHAIGAITLQRDFRIAPSTHSFVGASTITDAAAFYIDGNPTAGTNATFTRAWGAYNVGNTYLGGGLGQAIRVVTAAGAVTVTQADATIIVNKTVGAATTVNLPSTPLTGQVLVIKDGKGDAATNNITITPSSGNIDNAATYVINTNLASATIQFDGSAWWVV